MSTSLFVCSKGQLTLVPLSIGGWVGRWKMEVIFRLQWFKSGLTLVPLNIGGWVGSTKWEVGSKGRKSLNFKELLYGRWKVEVIRHLQWFKGGLTFWLSNIGGGVGSWKREVGSGG
jgi:hypothetical protein